ncbi:MAG: RNA-binding protein, partial [Desulfobacterales bacterium]
MELYVGNLPDNFSENELKSLFKSYRFKKLRIEKESGKSGLSGFVEVSEPAAVLKAVLECNGMMVKGRKIQVCNAAEREQIGKATVQKEKAASAPKEKHFSDQKRKSPLDSKGNFSSGRKGNYSPASKGKSQDARSTGQGGKNGEFPYR